jgi:predicted Holliday junction resolvase-like endonuclease
MAERKGLIEELQADPNIYGECPDPECGESFPLCKAIMFYIQDPIPGKVQQLIDQREQDLQDRINDLKEKRRRTKKRSETGAIAVGVGKILEKIAPAVRGFEFNPRDCRALFEPIDYIVFNGLTKGQGKVESLTFIDVKTGNAPLAKHQKQIKAALEKGKLTWDRYGGVL